MNAFKKFATGILCLEKDKVRSCKVEASLLLTVISFYYYSGLTETEKSLTYKTDH
jgi:hypothetical protein